MISLSRQLRRLDDRGEGGARVIVVEITRSEDLLVPIALAKFLTTRIKFLPHWAIP